MASLLLNAVECELLQTMHRNGVRFVVVGGHAVQFHGHLRPAKDLDIFYAINGDNPSRLREALVSLRIPHSQLPLERLESPKAQIVIGGSFNAEFLGHIEGVDFEAAFRDAVLVSECGMEVHVISRHHLLQNKRALGRSQDLEDVLALEKIAPAN